MVHIMMRVARTAGSFVNGTGIGFVPTAFYPSIAWSAKTSQALASGQDGAVRIDPNTGACTYLGPTVAADIWMSGFYPAKTP